MAFQWIMEHDNSYFSCPQQENTKKIIQRYVLAVIYYSTGGPHWDQCNAPLDFGDPFDVQKANNNCHISADGDDGSDIPLTLGTDAWLTPSDEC
eukprot:3237039-Ditylum_brightwellii.AAC.1